LPQRLRFHHLRIDGRRVIKGIYAAGQSFFIDVDDKINIRLCLKFRPEFVHFTKFPRGVHVEEREGQTLRPKRLAREMQQDSRVLAHRIEENEIAELSRRFTDDVDGFPLQVIKEGRISRSSCEHDILTALKRSTIRAAGSPPRCHLNYSNKDAQLSQFPRASQPATRRRWGTVA
jgi:hypothetical protein